MPWKKDDKNNLVVDENGNPVWTTEAGEDKPVDYAALAKRLSEVNAESKGRKEELRKSAERYARLKDIEDVSAWYERKRECHAHCDHSSRYCGADNRRGQVWRLFQRNQDLDCSLQSNE